jgi:hypothetical protein
MGFLKTKEEKDKSKAEKEKIKVIIRHRKESRRKAFQEQNKANEEIRKLYRVRSREERRLRESTKSRD